MKVTVTTKAGKSMQMDERYARILEKLGRVSYRTAHVPSSPVQKPMKAAAPQEAKAPAPVKEPEASPAPEPDEPDYSALTAADLLKQADDMKIGDFRAAAKVVLGEDAPEKKAEILEALQKKAG